MGKNGGARPGAGRPKGSLGKKARMKLEGRELIRKMVSERLSPMLESQLDLAEGLYYEKEDSNGLIKVYKNKPDKGAAQMLIDHAYGRAKESIEHTGKMELLVDV